MQREIAEASQEETVDSSTDAKAIKKLKRKIADCEAATETSNKLRKTKKNRLKSIKEEIALTKTSLIVKKELVIG